MKRRVGGERWTIELASGWKVEAGSHCFDISHSDGSGILQISAYRIGQPVTNQDLIKLIEDAFDEPIKLVEQSWGDFIGYQVIYQEAEVFWRKWWLRSGSTFVFCNLQL